MKRGRPRKYDPLIPAHIDQTQIPKGCYWHARDRYWYTIHPGPDGRPHRQRLAGRNATLAKLHALIENLNDSQQGTLAWLHEQFKASNAWKNLSESSHRDYYFCALVLTRTKTRLGMASELHADRLTKVHIQNLIDHIATDRPAMANHVKRYLGRLYTWGMQRGKCRERSNPAHGLEAAKERGQFKMPAKTAMKAAIAFARERGARKPHTKGSCPPYLWIVMLLAYRVRLRSIEVLTLTDANWTKQGVRTNRRKGSRDNITAWSPDMREAWRVAQDSRSAIWQRVGRPVPIQAEDRPLIVSEHGSPVTSSALSSAWDRFMELALREGVLTPEQAFTAHGLKHRGITDTSGDKQTGAGHVDPRTTKRYDHDVPVVKPSGGRHE